MRRFNMYCAPNSVAAVSTNKMLKTIYGLCPFSHAIRDNNAPTIIRVMYIILYADNDTKHFDF